MILFGTMRNAKDPSSPDCLYSVLLSRTILSFDLHTSSILQEMAACKSILTEEASPTPPMFAGSSQLKHI